MTLINKATLHYGNIVKRIEVDIKAIKKNVSCEFKGLGWREISLGFDRFDTLTKWTISTLNFIPAALSRSCLLSDSTSLEKNLNPFKTIVTQHKEVSYSLLWYESIVGKEGWIRKEVDIYGKPNGRTVFKYPGFAYTMTTLCNFGELLGFIHKYVYQMQFFSNLATQFGDFQIFGIKPFSYPVLCSFTTNPKDFFIFVACGINFTNYILDYIKMGNGSDKARANHLSIENLLKNVVYLPGKMAVVWLAVTPWSKTFGFICLAFVVDSVNLVAYFLKKKREAKFLEKN